METASEKNTATFVHLSALTQYFVSFIPFVNFIFPIIIWSSKKDKSEFIDFHGKQIINFEISLFLYSLILIVISLPKFFFTIINGITFKEVLFHNGFDIMNLDFENIFFFYFCFHIFNIQKVNRGDKLPYEFIYLQLRKLFYIR